MFKPQTAVISQNNGCFINKTPRHETVNLSYRTISAIVTGIQAAHYREDGDPGMRKMTAAKALPSAQKKSGPLHSIVAACVVIASIGLFEIWQRLNTETDTSAEVVQKAPVSIEAVSTVFAERRKTDPTYPLPGFIAEQLPSGGYQTQRNSLIAQAASAVAQGERLELGNRLALLGAAALSENDLAGARVYLDESLSVYEEEEDVIGIGSVELLRGRVETVARENARDAASAHDVMQVAAWMIVRNRFDEAEAPIRSAISENVRLRRFGAAAAGYEMLSRGYQSVSNRADAEAAASEAIRLHAASGRENKAVQILAQLEADGMPLPDVDALKSSIRTGLLDYENSVNEIRRARDYEHLYRRLLNAGDPVQAWQFREKANQSLAQASKRAMHRRQTGIVALLYNSNENRTAARNSLARARALFSAESRDDLVEHINSAEKQVW